MVLIGLFVLQVLGAGSCNFSSHHHDDDFNDDDHFHPVTVPGEPSSAENPYVLRVFEADIVPGRNGIAPVTAIEGVSLFGAGIEELGALELRQFTEQVLEANPDLFAMPESAGRLAFLGVDWPPDRIEVHHIHVDDEERPVGDQRLSFIFDRTGALGAIKSTVRW